MSLLDIAYQLTNAGEPYVQATVVWCERPSSAKPGAQAIIRKNGQITGWIGGSCTQPVVIHEAMRLLREGGEPYLLRIGTSATSVPIERSDIRVFPMTCASGGTLDIYMELHQPQPQLLLIGASPIISVLAQAAPALNFAVTVIDHADLSQVRIDERTYILVATHGQYDEDALINALPGPAAYVGLIASPRRAESCRTYLREAGIAAEHIARLKAPAGLNIGASTPEEIAISIMAELVQLGRQKQPVERETQASEEESTADEPAMLETAIDPVCGMEVEIANARHHSLYDERDFYFCCPSCKRQFERSPQMYLAQTR